MNPGTHAPGERKIALLTVVCGEGMIKLEGWPGNRQEQLLAVVSGGKSALLRAQRRVTPGWRNPQTGPQKRTALAVKTVRARVKRWCKRPPASGVILAARQPSLGARSSRSGAQKGGSCSFLTLRVDCWSLLVTAGQER